QATHSRSPRGPVTPSRWVGGSSSTATTSTAASTSRALRRCYIPQRETAAYVRQGATCGDAAPTSRRPLFGEVFSFQRTFSMTPRYEPHEIEAKWQRVWEDEGAFNVPNPTPGNVGGEAADVRAEDPGASGAGGPGVPTAGN